MTYKLIKRQSLVLALLTAFMISGCDSKKQSAVEKDCREDKNYERCTSDIAYYVKNYASLHENSWLSDNSEWIQTERLKMFESYSANTGRWVGNAHAVRQASPKQPFNSNIEDTNIFVPLLVDEAARDSFLNEYFLVNGAIYSASSLLSDDDEMRLDFLVTDARVAILGVERWEFGVSDLEALEFCDIDSFQHFVKPEYSQFACEGEFVFSFILNDVGSLDITLEAYKLKAKQIKELQEINVALSVEQATQRFNDHKIGTQSQ